MDLVLCLPNSRGVGRTVWVDIKPSTATQCFCSARTARAEDTHPKGFGNRCNVAQSGLAQGLGRCQLALLGVGAVDKHAAHLAHRHDALRSLHGKSEQPSSMQ